MDIGTPGLAATLRAPGMWLTAYSGKGRASNTVALPSARMRRISSVDTSGVRWLASPITAC